MATNEEGNCFARARRARDTIEALDLKCSAKLRKSLQSIIKFTGYGLGNIGDNMRQFCDETLAEAEAIVSKGGWRRNSNRPSPVPDEEKKEHAIWCIKIDALGDSVHAERIAMPGGGFIVVIKDGPAPAKAADEKALVRLVPAAVPEDDIPEALWVTVKKTRRLVCKELKRAVSLLAKHGSIRPVGYIALLGKTRRCLQKISRCRHVFTKDQKWAVEHFVCEATRLVDPPPLIFLPSFQQMFSSTGPSFSDASELFETRSDDSANDSDSDDETVVQTVESGGPSRAVIDEID